MLVSWLFPKTRARAEKTLDAVVKPLSIIGKYALIVAAVLLATRLVAGWLGWMRQ
jgi:hypothetical protein